MLKIMVFIDGTWLYANMPKLAQLRGDPDFHIDYGLLPRTLADSVAEQMRTSEPDLVRTYLFGSIADNYDPRDEDAVRRRRDFYRMLKEEFHYDVEVFTVNYYGKRLRPDDRDPKDRFEPKEKCVDIALATTALFYAGMPYGYDFAIAVVGDRDFIPVFQAIRRLGKRVAIASIRGCCSGEYIDQENKDRLRDLDMIWLDDLLERLELRYENQWLDCESPYHKGDRKVLTTFRPRKGQRFYCEECRKLYQAQHENSVYGTVRQKESPPSLDSIPAVQEIPTMELRTGSIKTIKRDKGYGFISADDGNDYFFHASTLCEGADWETLKENTPVQFAVKTVPSVEKAGAAMDVSPRMEDSEQENGSES
ncbi:MAG TPA: cold shock domain-containing protein [bacterium]|nr:cold shock domain-containing protein [bacterium]HPO07607.1 cold shock domain-containing protein [bacterium]HQO34045.1 cold shock domain-containing protein [bacterium]HQP97961.1 cold shock domain-containing protein [bacterium]